jgi:peptidoglycan/xylan/chitin deacetylase (PgdA/CDA1 family)
MNSLFIIAIVLLVSAFLFYASYNVGSNVFIKAYCDAKTDKKTIALTFDDGPHPEKTPAILDVLQKHNVKAVFFCIGTNIAGNEELIKRIHNEGHVIGNHTFIHSTWYDLLPAYKMKEDLLQTEELIYGIIGKRVRLFRPPYGVTNPMLAKAVKSMRYKVMGWSIRSLDTVKKDRHKVVNKIIRLIKPGAIILLHDRCIDSELVVNDVIEHAVLQGYTIERADLLLNLESYD